MTIGIILIVSILLLGGVLATLGDRIGMKVGKARLSLFKLRPRKTATLVTIATGVTIAGTTLGILFATSEPLRRGIFAYDRTLKKLRAAHRELKETRVQKIHVETQLAQARDRHAAVQQHLDEINQSLQAALAQQGVTEAKLAQAHAQLSMVSRQMETLGAEITQLQRERQELIGQRDEVKRQIARQDRAIAQRDREITQLDKHIAERDHIIGQRDQMIAQLDSKIAQRDQMIADRDDIIAQRELRLKGLETEQSFLERQVNMLQQYYQEYQELRLGNVALRRGQILADGVVRILSPTAAKDAVDHLLRQANKAAISQVTYPHGNAAVDEQVIQITQAEVEQLTNRISNGKDYVVRILSAGNYVYGENAVRVFADVAVNKIVFLTNEAVAFGSVDASRMSEDEILQRLDLLIASSKFRARRAGIIGTTIQIADGSPKTLVQFIEHLMITKEPLEIQAVAAEVTYTAGPLKIELVAIRDGEVLFRT
ncbi:MAG: DUF3084 domain-containing protein [Hormoscilla sp. GM102CHS1]|nr:DUF3084 domain-containing protein [Hormoscilla sp. GM102CHS1]